MKHLTKIIVALIYSATLWFCVKEVTGMCVVVEAIRAGMVKQKTQFQQSAAPAKVVKR